MSIPRRSRLSKPIEIQDLSGLQPEWAKQLASGRDGIVFGAHMTCLFAEL
jgi:hypothetical protein